MFIDDEYTEADAQIDLQDFRKHRHLRQQAVFGVLPTWHIGPCKGRTADFSGVDADGDLLYIGASEHITKRLLNMPHVMQTAMRVLANPGTVASIAVAFWVRADNWLYERYLHGRCAPLWAGTGFSDKRRIERNKRRCNFEHGQRYIGRFVDPHRYVQGKFISDSAAWLDARADESGRVAYAYPYECRRMVRAIWTDAGLDGPGVYAWLLVPAFTPERARAVLIGAGARRRKALKRMIPVPQADERPDGLDEGGA